MKTAVHDTAILMDKVFPGWENKIELDILDQGNPYYCILGQLGGKIPGGFSKNMKLLDAAGYNGSGHFSRKDYNKDWVQEIQTRWVNSPPKSLV